MIIEISGGKSGIKEYLEKGMKEGRTLSRDELDTRIVLMGDLALADSIAQALETDGERYFHFTFSLTERGLSNQLMQSMVEDFVSYLCAGYEVDEYHAYAERQIPITQFLVDEKTRELKERFDHIHLVIPKVNLVTGARFDPMEMLKVKYGSDIATYEFIDAFQEHINQKHNLTSPKDRQRTDFSGQSDILSRVKGDHFKGSYQALKTEVLDRIVNENITTRAGLKELLSGYGQVDIGKRGQQDHYFKVKLAGERKFIRFDHPLFSDAFLAKSPAEKRAYVERKSDATPISPKRTPAENLTLMAQWKAQRSREIRYLHTDSSFYKKTYSKADQATKLVHLDRLEAAHFTKLKEDHGYERASHFAHRNTQRQQPNPAALAAIRANHPLQNGVRQLSECHLAKNGERESAGLLHSTSRHDRYDIAGLRRANLASKPGADGNRPVDSVIGQALADQGNVQLQRDRKPEMAEITKTLSARCVLDFVAEQYLRDVSEYSIGKAKDGSDTILCGTHHYKVGDFFTKELMIPFKDAAPVLRQLYDQQRGIAVPDHALQHTAALSLAASTLDRQGAYADKLEKWRSQRTEYATDKAKIKLAMTELRELDKAERSGVHAAYKDNKEKIKSQNLPRPDKAIAWSILAATRSNALMALNARLAAERVAISDKYSTANPGSFQQYLATEANQGDVEALAALRNANPEPSLDGSKTYITSAKDTQADVYHRNPELTYRATTSGTVSYLRLGQEILRDEGRVILVSQPSNDYSVEMALRMANAKFGREIVLTASDTPEGRAFKELAIQIAVDKNINITFSDPALEGRRLEVLAEKIALQAAIIQTPAAVVQDKKQDSVAKALPQRAKEDVPLQVEGDGASKKNAESELIQAIEAPQLSVRMLEPVVVDLTLQQAFCDERNRFKAVGQHYHEAIQPSELSKFKELDFQGMRDLGKSGKKDTALFTVQDRARGKKTVSVPMDAKLLIALSNEKLKKGNIIKIDDQKEVTVIARPKDRGISR